MSDSEDSQEELSAIAIEPSVYNKPLEISNTVQQADSDIAVILGPLIYPNVIVNCKICQMLYDLVCARVLADLYDQEEKGRQADLYELAFHKFYEVISNYRKKAYPQNELFR
jgi:antirestriction protein